MNRLPHAAPLLLALFGCGCAPREPAANTSVDIGRAASDAQGTVDAYGKTLAMRRGGRVSRDPAPTSTPAIPRPPAPGTPDGLPDDRTPVSEAPFTPDGARGAADVVQTYYTLIGERKYAGARALWEAGATGAGTSPAAFAAAFAGYSEYRAMVGAPGRIDAGAGQRYIEVPVQISARLRRGGVPVYEIGSAILHRTGDIDGATAAQRAWHIQRIATGPAAKPMPAP